MSRRKKPKVNWPKVEESILIIAFGLILLVAGWSSVIILILSGAFIVTGSAYLLSIPQVRNGISLVVHWKSRKQVAKTRDVSDSNVVQNVNVERGDVQIHQQTAPGKRPFLTVSVRLVSGLALGKLGLRIEMENIGEGIATEVQGEVRVEGSEPLELLDSGKLLDIPPLGPGKIAFGDLWEGASPKLLSQTWYWAKVTYKDVDGVEMKPIEVKGTFEELRRKLTNSGLERVRREYGI